MRGDDAARGKDRTGADLLVRRAAEREGQDAGGPDQNSSAHTPPSCFGDESKYVTSID